jgi:hypothetical protein
VSASAAESVLLCDRDAEFVGAVVEYDLVPISGELAPIDAAMPASDAAWRLADGRMLGVGGADNAARTGNGGNC